MHVIKCRPGLDVSRSMLGCRSLYQLMLYPRNIYFPSSKTLLVHASNLMFLFHPTRNVLNTSYLRSPSRYLDTLPLLISFGELVFLNPSAGERSLRKGFALKSLRLDEGAEHRQDPENDELVTKLEQSSHWCQGAQLFLHYAMFHCK